jgi:hypothetical protein
VSEWDVGQDLQVQPSHVTTLNLEEIPISTKTKNAKYLYLPFTLLLFRKAIELMRLAEAKSHTSAGLQLTGSCRAVILLDLAANALGEPIDKVSPKSWLIKS